MNKRLLFIILIIVRTCTMIFSLNAFGEDEASSRLYAAHSLKCKFSEGIGTTWDGLKQKISSQRNDDIVQFDSIDINKHSARVIGNLAAGDVSVISNEVGLTFIEIKPLVLSITTVFSANSVNTEFISVDTRHVNVFGTPMAEQYYGSCKIWQ